MNRKSYLRHAPAFLTFAALLGIAGAGLGVAATAGPWLDTANSKVRLVSGTLDRDGKPATFAGIQLRMDPGWKTYWRNPGDSGVPPSFDWQGSKNLKKAEVMFPAPHRFADAGGTAIGYDEEVVFPVKITPEREGEPVELALAFDFGLCMDLCIPNQAQLNVTLDPGAGKGDARLIDTALENVPRDATADGLPRIARITADLDGPVPGLTIEALFDPKATGTDLFIDAGDIYVPIPKATAPLAGGKQSFVVAFATREEAAAIKGKPLTLTLVSNEGSTETVWTSE
jgi:DsbC/DsbD-like thiol-disulfide interchange protein